MRTCGQCGETAETVRFYPSIRSYCAACWRQEVRLQRQVKREYYALARQRKAAAQRVWRMALTVARTLQAARCFVPGAGE